VNLLPRDEIAKLILNFRAPELTHERREKLVEFAEYFTPPEVEALLSCETMPAEEIAFLRACYGLPETDARPLPGMKPSKTPILRLL
jgi:hypothetical protein